MRKEGVSVEQVMEEVNRAVAAPQTLLADLWAEEKPNAPNLSFLYPPHSKSLEVNLDLVSRNWEVDGDFEITSRRRLAGGLAVSLKRFLRGLLSWYINPILHQVRKFNMLVTRTLYDLSNNVKELQDRVSHIEKRDEEERLLALEQRLERLENGEDE
ncbi:MAG: hypothetical protein KKE79_09185 [Actinobacteria bacterium]|nr:hypothetical protein [Actinomycetota bacterium]MBU4386377.1 hypothetical protein [Actinomycetota bacterium]MBU4490790.1 hypothetical protein [Actinomycetota bacterium]MCG2794859.1 hypothetical protein [Actinomycetes bacterium]